MQWQRRARTRMKGCMLLVWSEPPIHSGSATSAQDWNEAMGLVQATTANCDSTAVFVTCSLGPAATHLACLSSRVMFRL